MTSDNYPTDSWIKVLFEDWFDPCQLSNGELREFDGLGSWKDKTFVNPPYSNPLPWVKKAIEESRKGKRIVLLLKADTSTRWFAELQNNGAKFLWINGRLKYQTGKPAPFPSMIAILTQSNHSPQTGEIPAARPEGLRETSAADTHNQEGGA